jgi:hypothetical protein
LSDEPLPVEARALPGEDLAALDRLLVNPGGWPRSSRAW